MATKNVTKESSDNRILENLVFPGGKSLTLEAGSTFDFSLANTTLPVIPVAKGGTGQITQALSASVLGIRNISAESGNPGWEVARASTSPAFTGQVAIAYNGNKLTRFMLGGSTSLGDWNYAFDIPGGMVNIGDGDWMDPINGLNTNIQVNGCPTNWAASGDGLVTSKNWSTSTASSGSGFNVAVMRSDGFGVTGISITSGGTGYTVGDLLVVPGAVSGLSCYIRVSSVSSGVINGIQLVARGRYAATPTTPSSVTGGTGTGASIGLTSQAASYPAISDNSAAFMHVPANRTSSLIPGYTMTVLNRNTTHNKGYAICSPGIGLDAGNYSFVQFDMVNKITRFPFFVSGKFQPSDSGWIDSLTHDPTLGIVSHFKNNGTSIAKFNGASYEPSLYVNSLSSNINGTGTASTTIGSHAVTGVGTLFLTEVQIGSLFVVGGNTYTVSAVASNTALTIIENAGASVSGQSFTYLSPVSSQACGGSVARRTVIDGNGGLIVSSNTTPYFWLDRQGTRSWQLNVGTANSGEFGIATPGATPFLINGDASNGALRVTSTGVTVTGAQSISGSITTTGTGSTLFVKSGTNAKAGTFTLTAGTVTVANTSVTANSVFTVTLKTAGGVRTGIPDIVPTSGVGFVATQIGGVADTSTYNFIIQEVN